MAELRESMDTPGMTKRRLSNSDVPFDFDIDQARAELRQPIRFLSLNQVLDRLSVGRSTLYSQIKDSVRPFPSPVHIGRRSVWVESEVEAFMASLILSERNS
ncbi:helix-turn-helix transcriptional regulator [Hyphomonas atlantica corrig.]|uniref:helix-turn-helix transcriptional regulator n=1 Tax=Hyphomonas atlantica TaxID=1280948 RepID=UPI003B5AFC55